MKIQNATQLPKIYYGLHMCEGVARYKAKDGSDQMIFIGEKAIKDMGPSFAGLPVYSRHVADVVLETMEREAVGYVSESFYNPIDGKHWVKFLVTGDLGHQALALGWRISNSYDVIERGPRGKWHNVEYDLEVTKGRYDHLAIVPDPRYDESIVLTAEQFKDYNSAKEQELLSLKNSKEENQMLGKLFKKAKVENEKEIGETIVTLKNGREVSILTLINEAEEKKEEKKDNELPAFLKKEEEKKENELPAVEKKMEEKKENEVPAVEKTYANAEHMVKLHDGSEVSVAELTEKYKNAVAPKEAPMAEEKKENEAPAVEEKKEEKKMNWAAFFLVHEPSGRRTQGRASTWPLRPAGQR